MGVKINKKKEGKKAERQAELEQLAQLARGAAGSPRSRAIGVLNLVTLVGIIAMISYQLPVPHVLLSVSLGCAALHFVGESSPGPRLMALWIVKGVAMLANWVILQGTEPTGWQAVIRKRHGDTHGRAVVAIGTGFGVGYAAEQLHRFLIERLDATPTLTKESGRQLKESGKDGMTALRQAEREAAYRRES